MPPINLQNLNQQQIDALREVLSPDRFNTYLIASGHNEERAMLLYTWNALVGEAFYVPSQAVEVGLRNRINHALSARYGNDWWKNQGFLSVVDSQRAEDLKLVTKRIRAKGLPLVTGQVVAGLSFGFWAGMLQKRYNPDVWSRYLRTSFPHLSPDINRGRLSEEVRNLVELRNRISHHEPLIRRNLMNDHSRVMQLLSWMCPTKAAWLKPYCRAPAIIRQKP